MSLANRYRVTVAVAMLFIASLARSVMVRGAGLEVVYLPLCVLALIATVLVGFSAWRFRGS